jgi:hypothetical protein
MNSGLMPDPTLEVVLPILIGVVGPILISGIVYLMAWRPWRTNASGRRPLWAGAPAIGLAFAVGHIAIVGWPGRPPLSGEWWNYPVEKWLLFVVAFAAVLAMASSAIFRSRLVDQLLSIPAAVLVVGLMLSPMFKHSWSGGAAAAWLIGLSVAIVLLRLSIDVASAGMPGPGFVAALVIVATGMSVCLLLCSNASSAQLAGSLAAALGAAWVVALWRRDVSLAGGGATVVAVVMAGLLLLGMFYAHPTMPRPAAALLAAAPSAMWMRRLPPIARMRAGWGWGMGLGCVIVLTAGAVAITAIANAPADDGYGDYADY